MATIMRSLFSAPTVYRNIVRSSVISKKCLQRAQSLKVTPFISRKFCTADPKPKKDTVTITFIDRDGDRILTLARLGQNLLDVALDNDVDVEGRGVLLDNAINPQQMAPPAHMLSQQLYSLKSKVTITFLTQNNERQEVKCKLGDNLLDVIVEQDLDLDGFGACEGTLACSTCHLIFSDENYKQLPETPTDEELDMLDLAYGLTDTSRLGCQVIVTKEMEGWEIQVPEGVADAREP